MVSSYITNSKELLTTYMEDSSYYIEKGGKCFSWGVQHGTHFLSESLNMIIKFLNQSWNFQPPELQKKFNIIWKYAHNTSITQDDTLCQHVQKVAFALLISLPTSFIINDFAMKSSQLGLPYSFTPSGLISHIVNKCLYLHVMGSIIDFTVNLLDENPTEPLPIVKEQEQIK